MLIAVRLGQVTLFDEVKKQHQSTFQRDRTYILIQRLHHNVIKTGLRAISTSYSKISLEDIAKKLALQSPEDAEFIVAKVPFKQNQFVNYSCPMGLDFLLFLIN